MTNPSKKIVQFSTVNALLVGLYDGVFPLKAIQRHGNFGIGCSHAMDGEALFLNDDAYVARAQRPLEPLGPDHCMPFAQIVEFAPEATFPAHGLSKDTLSDELVGRVGSRNLFIAVRVEGRFKSLKLRRPPTIGKPYPAMVEFLAHQEEQELADISGIMVGFWSPQTYQGISVSGLHIHFMNDDRSLGGHVLAFEIDQADIAYEALTSLDIKFPTSKDFLGADLNYQSLDEHVRKVEG